MKALRAGWSLAQPQQWFCAKPHLLARSPTSWRAADLHGEDDCRYQENDRLQQDCHSARSLQRSNLPFCSTRARHPLGRRCIRSPR